MKQSLRNYFGKFYQQLIVLWDAYHHFIKARIITEQDLSRKDMVYWQNELFVKTAALTLPAGSIVLIPSVLIAWTNGSVLIALVNVITLIAVSSVILVTHLPIKVKMGISVSMLTVFGVFLIATLGSFGLGSLYLLAISVLISLLFSYRIAFLSIGINVLIYAAFAWLIWDKHIAISLSSRFSLELWLTYSVNFIFLNFIVVVEIRHILSGLQSTIEQEQKLLTTLNEELITKTKSAKKLEDSEGHYRSLFVHNPLPMWIFDPDTLLFLQVNDAAVSKYGYTYEEFLNMTIEQIRTEPTHMIAEGLHRTLREGSVFSNVAIHQKKNNSRFHVKVRCSTIPFDGKLALLVIANDITTQISHSEAIAQQNDKLKNIAYLQSHTIRAPLAKIMGLWNILELDRNSIFENDFYEYLKLSMVELDEVIKKIIVDTSAVSPDSKLEDEQQTSSGKE